MTNTSGQGLDSGGSVVDSILANPKAIAEVAVRAMFPCLVFGATLVQPRNEMLINQLLNTFGQILLLIGLVSASVIVLVLQRAPRLFLFALGSVVTLRITRRLIGDVPEIELAYHLATGLLFAVAGAATLIHRPDVLHRQMIAFVVISIPIMLLQVLGVPWSNALRTDDSGRIAAYELGSLLLQSVQSDIGLNVFQLRPAGLLHANVFLSMVMLPTMAIHFSRWRGGGLKWSDIALASVVVLAMSKILLLAMIVFVFWYFVAGPAQSRLRAVKLAGAVALLLSLYIFSFPSAAAHNLSPTSAMFNFAVRFADVQAVLAGHTEKDVSLFDSEGTLLHHAVYEAGQESAISVMARYWPVVLPLSLVVSGLLINALRTFRQLRPDLADLARNGILAALMALLITSFLGSPFFAFWAGGVAIMPFLVRRARLA